MTLETQTPRQRRYWASRISKDNLSLLARELCFGRLRQGWGWLPDQDLRKIFAEVQKGGNWWGRLSAEVKSAYRNYPFLPQWGEDTIRADDIVLVPNCPEFGYISLARVQTDEYDFQPIPTGTAEEVDYGHLRKVELLSPSSGIPSDHTDVTSEIRATLRCRSRIWRIDYLRENIEDLLEKVNSGVFDSKQHASPEHRYNTIITTARSAAMEAARIAARNSIETLLDSSFYAAELEIPVKKILEVLYPGSSVEPHGGIEEAKHGTDLLVKIPNPILEVDNLIPVQVKKHVGETSDGVEQLRLASEYWKEKGKIVALALITTASEQTDTAKTELDSLEKETGISCVFINRQKLIDLFVEAVLMQQFIRWC